MNVAGCSGDLPWDRPPSAAVWISADGTRRVYTRRSRTFLASLALFGGSVTAMGLGSEFAITDVSTGRICGFGIFALGLLVTYRVMRMAIVVTPGRLTLRGFWRARSLPASDIARFEPPLPYGMDTLRQPGLRVVMTSGRTLSAGVFQVGQLDGASVGVAESAELNLWLRLQRSPVVAAPLPAKHGLTGAAAFAWYAWLTFLGLLALVSAAVVIGVLATLDEVSGGVPASLGP